MSDLISRQAAIDALHMHLMYRMGTDSNKKRLDDWINGVPSVQPEQSSEIQDILEYLDTVLHPIISPDHWNVYSELHDMISMLPSAQPERKKGKWIDETFEPWGLVYHPYKCDQCGEHSEADSNFCPNCGADMRGEQDE